MMTNNNELNDQDVAEFLRSNPDFLQRHPEFLADLATPAETGNVVDFQKLMVNKLRADKQRAEDRQRTLVNNARSNMTVQARVHAAVVRLVEARNLEDLGDIIGQELALMLEVDIVTLGMEAAFGPATANLNGLRSLDAGLVDRLLGERDSLLETNIKGDEALFGPAARLVKSQALLRLHIAEGLPDALLAFGSRDPLLFSESQGTELVGFMADVIERLLRHFIGAA